jgi:hypothetical protein
MLPEATGQTFPTQELEVTLEASRSTVSKGNADEPAWETITTWATQVGRTYVVESQRADGEWKTSSAPFEGDGKPVDFVDRFEVSDGSVSYRLVSTQTSNGQLPQVGRLQSGFIWDPSVKAILAHLDFDLAAKFSYSLQKSHDAVAWVPLVTASEKQSVEVSIEDPAPIDKAPAHYRLFINAPPTYRAPVAVPQGAAISRRRLAEASTAQQAELQRQREQSAKAGTKQRQLNRVVRSLEFQVVEKPVAAGTNYVVIDLDALGMKGTIVANNDSGDVLSFVANEDGTQNMLLWVGSKLKSYDISQMTGQKFHRVLALDNSRAMLGSVMEDGQEVALGYRVKIDGKEAPEVIPLTSEEIKDFKLIRNVPKFEGDVRIDGEDYTSDGKGGLTRKVE